MSGPGPAAGDRPHEADLRAALIEACRRMYARGLVGGGEGNASARLGDGTFLVTRSGVNKGYLVPDDLLVVGPDGRVLRGRGRPSSELAMHLAVYRLRPETGAVLHAHPPAAVAHTVAGRPLEALLPEAAVLLGERVPVAPFAVPGTPALADSLASALGAGATVALLERHGAVALGPDPLAAEDKLESLENVARISLLVALLGGAAPLPPDVRAAVVAAARAAGLA
jgi:L-fuculose-phosphate aldolase